MTVKDLKEQLIDVPDDCNVVISIRTPSGYICPDGAACNVRGGVQGRDWHSTDFIIIPTCQLQLTEDGFSKWVNNE